MWTIFDKYDIQCEIYLSVKCVWFLLACRSNYTYTVYNKSIYFIIKDCFSTEFGRKLIRVLNKKYIIWMLIMIFVQSY